MRPVAVLQSCSRCIPAVRQEHASAATVCHLNCVSNNADAHPIPGVAKLLQALGMLSSSAWSAVGMSGGLVAVDRAAGLGCEARGAGEARRDAVIILQSILQTYAIVPPFVLQDCRIVVLHSCRNVIKYSVHGGAQYDSSTQQSCA
jgi:hypothetical protein